MGLSLVLATTSTVGVVVVFRTLLLWRTELLLLLLLLTFHISSLILYILRLGLRYDEERSSVTRINGAGGLFH